MYQTKTATQTTTQARRLASRIGAELLQLSSLYGGKPSQAQILKFTDEAEAYLSAGYLDHVRYGFRRNGYVILELVYTARQASGVDEKPGRIPVGIDITGASWFSHLTQNTTWFVKLSDTERAAFEASLPLERVDAPTPKLAAGLKSTSKEFSEDTLGLKREARYL